MSYSWNVYKLFTNGNRAKAPFAVVDSEDCDSGAFMVRMGKILEEKFGRKAVSTKYKIMRSDLPQEERVDDEERKNLALRNRVLALKITALGLDLQKMKTAGALIMSGDTNWKWQWCVVRMASNQFIAALSPEFNSAEGAQEWMNDEIEQIVT